MKKLNYFGGTSLVVVLGAVLICVGCGSKTAVKDFDAAKSNSESDTRVKKGVKPEADPEVAVIETETYGRIVIELYSNLAPQMVGRFKQLIKDGFYNGTTFHRIDPETGIIQGGDPLSKDDNPLNDGSGDSSYANVPAEFSDIDFSRGIVAAARRSAAPEMDGQSEISEAQAMDTANCQFFITLKRQPEFDEAYTAFGKVIEGISNADVIAGAPVAEGSDRPADKIVIKTITLKPRSEFIK
jgi:peptidyl-prolyl cis-trans isomerase B (cyclophilin B)